MPQLRHQRPTICLNMIVRNEAHVVTSTLDSLVTRIDYWVIVDTGSNDDTIQLIQTYFRNKGIPGELYERPWKNFGDNRTEALDLCQGKADYIWVMDADDLLVGNPDFSRLTLDSYYLRFDVDVTYWRMQIFRSGRRWVYRGVVHEYPVCLEPSSTTGRIKGSYYVESRRLGHRNFAADKSLQDARLLQEELKRAPNDARTVFYLAHSYLDARVFDQALHYYTQRSRMGGSDEQVYYSLYCRAFCLELLREDWPICHDAYLAAWRMRPRRAEALHRIARSLRLQRRFDTGYIYAKTASQIPYPEDELLPVESDVYAWRIYDELSICAYQLGLHRENFDICTRLLENSRVPEPERERILRNREFSTAHIQD